MHIQFRIRGTWGKAWESNVKDNAFPGFAESENDYRTSLRYEFRVPNPQHWKFLSYFNRKDFNLDDFQFVFLLDKHKDLN